MTRVTPTVTPSRVTRDPHGLACSSVTQTVTQGHAAEGLTLPLSKWGAREGLGPEKKRPAVQAEKGQTCPLRPCRRVSATFAISCSTRPPVCQLGGGVCTDPRSLHLPAGQVDSSAYGFRELRAGGWGRHGLRIVYPPPLSLPARESG